MSKNTILSENIDFSSQVQPSEEQLITVPSRLLQSLQERIEALESMVEFQGKEIKALRATQPGITACRVDDAFEAIRDIDEHLARIDQQTRTAAPPRGEKTLARIAKLKETLKSRGQGMTLKDVGRLLELRPNQVTVLVLQLDKRVFEVFVRAGDARQKVIRLRSFT